MKHLYLISLLVFLFPVNIFAQDDSTSKAIETTPVKLDTAKNKIARQKVIDTLKNTPLSTFKVDLSGFGADSLSINDSIILADSVLKSQYYDSIKKASIKTASPKIDDRKNGEVMEFAGKELIFYYLLFLLLLIGLIRRAFPKYFFDLFRVFFRTTLKQRQTQEQLLQSPMPSIFMNCFFVLSAGLYANFLLQHFQLVLSDNFWLQYLYCVEGLSAIYLVKYVGLKITGWLFNVSNATDSYTFIVFIINKMLGIFLLPFLLIIAFTSEPLYAIALILSWFGITILIFYRFILSYSAIRKEVKLNSFHFILYIFGFEIIPLLLIYKLLLVVF